MKIPLYSILTLIVFLGFAVPMSHAASKTTLKAFNLERSENDRKRDKRSKPEKVVPLLKLKPGDVVADIFGGEGYYSEIISAEVGSKGKVILQNNLAYVKYVKDALTKRMANVAENIEQIQSETEDLTLQPGSLDAALIVISYHDIYYEEKEYAWGPHDKDKFLAQIHKALKPGARFLIVDHNSASGRGAKDCKSLHRLEKSTAIRDIEAAGFKLVEEDDSLRNPMDDYSVSVFDKKVRYKTDRYVLAFEKVTLRKKSLK